MKLAYIGQNQDSGLNPKNSGVILLKAKLLNPKHGELCLPWKTCCLICQRVWTATTSHFFAQYMAEMSERVNCTRQTSSDCRFTSAAIGL